LLPRSWTIEPSSHVCALDDEHIYLAALDHVSVLPRAGGAARRIETAPFLCSAARAPSHVLVRQQSDASFDVIDGATGKVQRIAGSLPTPHGETVYYVAEGLRELTGGRSTVRWTGAAAITQLAVGATAVAFKLADGHLVRLERTTGASVTIAVPPGIDQLAVADDGSVWFSIGTQLHRWAGAGPRLVTAWPELRHVMGFLPDGAALALATNTAAWTVTPGGALRRVTAPSRLVVFGGTRSLGTLDVPTNVTLAYLDTGERIVRSIRDAIGVAVDDRGLVVIRGATRGQLQLYQDPVPADPTKLRAWIDAATNAVIEPGGDELTWR
jgi:hypothetical protein